MIDRQILWDSVYQDLDLAPELRSCMSSPEWPTDPELVERWYQLHNLNRKANAGTVPTFQSAAAFEKFEETQTRLRDLDWDLPKSSPIWAAAREIIRDLLPEFDFVKEDVWELCTFGPGTFHGALKELRNAGYSLHYKVGGDQTVTRKCKDLALAVIKQTFPNWASCLAENGSNLSTIDGNRLAYVPKDVRSCRPIAIEPSLNVFLQQGIGRWLGRFAKSKGFVDIYDGQSVQRRKAGCLSNATIDLSSASDTISTELVKYLFPWDWFVVMDTVRSHTWSYKGQSGVYENFSSQGNAFTFPLESIIFKAVTMAATGLSSSEVSVYGDDIIVPLEHFDEACAALTLSGFVVNAEKSFGGQHDDLRKQFRESCGADYFLEKEITPVYYRENARHPADVATLFNRLYERWGFMPHTHSYLLSLVSPRERLIGPRKFISDGPTLAQFAGNKLASRDWTFGNSVVAVYDAWFWDIPELESVGFSGKAWFQKGSRLARRLIISARTSELAFLLGDQETVPRMSRRVTRKCVVTPAPSDRVPPVRWCMLRRSHQE